MAPLATLVARFVDDERGAANILSLEQVTAQAVAAVEMFAGFATLSDTVNPIGEALEITESEWGWIRPLFVLYAEREQALQLEATRGLGAEVFGRATSEISADIERKEAELPRQAFLQPVFSV